MSKKSFILYLDQQDLFNKLPDDIAGKLIKHIFSYVNCEDPKTDELIIDVAFASIKQALKRDLEKWTGQREQRSEAGKKSAEKRANEKQRKATTVESRSTNPTVSVNASVSVSDSDTKRKENNATLVLQSFGFFWKCWIDCKKSAGVKNTSAKALTETKFKKMFNSAYFTKNNEQEFRDEINAMCKYAKDGHKIEGFNPFTNMQTGKFLTSQGWK